MLNLHLTSLLMLMLTLLIAESNAMTDTTIAPSRPLETWNRSGGDPETMSYSVDRVPKGAFTRAKSLFKFKIFPREVNNEECFRTKSCAEKIKTKAKPKRDPYMLSITDKPGETFQENPFPAEDNYDTPCCCCGFCCP